MQLTIHAHLDYDFTAPTDVLAQIEAAATPAQRVLSERLVLPPHCAMTRVASDEATGTRFWIRPEGRVTIDYRAQIAISRQTCGCAALPATPLAQLPAEVVRYLMPSRYCAPDLFERFVHTEFAGLEGGAMAVAIRDWIARTFTYASGASNGTTTAADSFVRRQGVCRDYAHVLIALARTAGIPARIASVYAPDVSPQDFHAVAEVWLAGGWHLLDATGMATPDQIAVIGVGRDAADVAFLTAFGAATMLGQRVQVFRG